MQLIEFKTIMNELGIPVNGKEANFLGVNIKLISNTERVEMIGVKLDDLPTAVKENLKNSSSCSYSTFEHGYMLIENRDIFIQAMIDVAYIAQRSCLLKHGDLCSRDVMRIDINSKLFDLFGHGTKSSEQWQKEHNIDYSIDDNLTELDIRLKELLAEFDELVNPFISDNYRILLPSSYSNKFQFVSSNMTGNYDPEHIDYKIVGIASPITFETGYTDISSPTQYDQVLSLTPSLNYYFDYYNPYYCGNYSKNIVIVHRYTSYSEELVITIPGEKPIIIADVNKSTANDDYPLEKRVAISKMEKAIETIKKAYVGHLCSPVVNKHLVAE